VYLLIDGWGAIRLDGDIVPFLTLNSDYEFVDTFICKQENHYSGMITIHKKSGTFDNSSSSFVFASINSNFKSCIRNGYGICKSNRYGVSSSSKIELFTCYIWEGKECSVSQSGMTYLSFYADFIEEVSSNRSAPETKGGDDESIDEPKEDER
jgi:hypothetical protein